MEEKERNNGLLYLNRITDRQIDEAIVGIKKKRNRKMKKDRGTEIRGSDKKIMKH